MGEVAVAEAGDSVPVGAAVAEQLRETGNRLHCKPKLREAGERNYIEIEASRGWGKFSIKSKL